MNKTIDDILSELQNLFREVLDNDAIELGMETTMDDVDEWDSLSHLEIITEITKKFDIELTTTEMSLWENAGDIAATIASKVR